MDHLHEQCSQSRRILRKRRRLPYCLGRMCVYSWNTIQQRFKTKFWKYPISFVFFFGELSIHFLHFSFFQKLNTLQLNELVCIWERLFYAIHFDSIFFSWIFYSFPNQARLFRGEEKNQFSDDDKFHRSHSNCRF